jgi:hypothetical protein
MKYIDHLDDAEYDLDWDNMSFRAEGYIFEPLAHYTDQIHSEKGDSAVHRIWSGAYIRHPLLNDDRLESQTAVWDPHEYKITFIGRIRGERQQL